VRVRDDAWKGLDVRIKGLFKYLLKFGFSYEVRERVSRKKGLVERSLKEGYCKFKEQKSFIPWYNNLMVCSIRALLSVKNSSTTLILYQLFIIHSSIITLQ